MGGGGDDLGGETKDILSEKKIILSIKEKKIKKVLQRWLSS